ncbi:very short patch repair endonuclease [Chloroflexota bacterium]
MINGPPQDNVTPERRSWIMSRIRNKDTAPEIKLRRELWQRGLRYRKEYKRLPGKPDIVFVKSKVVVFVDGAFWHGKKLSEHRLNMMTQYWRDKIKRNIERDAKVTSRLQEEGYVVLRFLDTDIMKEAPAIAKIIEATIKNRTY